MRSRRQRDRGAIAVFAALVLIVVGAFMALALNVGFIMNTRGQLQNASDSAALAAAASLDGTFAGIESARRMALAYSNAHQVTGAEVQIDPSSDVIFGRWSFGCGQPGTDCFEPLDPNAIDPLLGTVNYFRITAVKIVNGRDGGTHNGPLQTFFGYFLQHNQPTNVPSAAIAIGRRARVDCSLPFGIAACKVLEAGELDCSPGKSKTITLSNENADSIGFINVMDDGSANPSTSWVRDAIVNRAAACANQDFKTVDARMANGDNLNDQIIDALLGQDQQGVWGECLLGKEVTVAVTDNQGCDLDNPQFNQTQRVIGYAQVLLSDITCSDGSHASCPPPEGPPTKCTGNKPPKESSTVAANRSITLQVLCSAPNGSGSGDVLRLVH